jgi:hypothetical protein
MKYCGDCPFGFPTGQKIRLAFYFSITIRNRHSRMSGTPFNLCKFADEWKQPLRMSIKEQFDKEFQSDFFDAARRAMIREKSSAFICIDAFEKRMRQLMWDETAVSELRNELLDDLTKAIEASTPEFVFRVYLATRQDSNHYEGDHHTIEVEWDKK